MIYRKAICPLKALRPEGELCGTVVRRGFSVEIDGPVTDGMSSGRK